MTEKTTCDCLTDLKENLYQSLPGRTMSHLALVSRVRGLGGNVTIPGGRFKEHFVQVCARFWNKVEVV